MNGIIGFSELVLTPGIPDEERKEYNNIISQSCRQLLGVVNDIIDISKIESGIIELNKQPVNLNQLLQEVYSLHHLAARKGDIVLELYTGIEQDNSYILTDDVKLRQVLNNLLGNAIKFTEHGSVKFGYTLNDRMLEFFVSDTGIGIPADDQERIFERFTQEDISNTRKYGGTGLGLSIAKAYVEKLGGKIWVQSRLNQGSRFFFTVPFESIQLKGNNLKKSKPSAQMNKI
jgi:signal transduction histidine kinase